MTVVGNAERMRASGELDELYRLRDELLRTYWDVDEEGLLQSKEADHIFIAVENLDLEKLRVCHKLLPDPACNLTVINYVMPFFHRNEYTDVSSFITTHHVNVMIQAAAALSQQTHIPSFGSIPGEYDHVMEYLINHLDRHAEIIEILRERRVTDPETIEALLEVRGSNHAATRSGVL